MDITPLRIHSSTQVWWTASVKSFFFGCIKQAKLSHLFCSEMGKMIGLSPGIKISISCCQPSIWTHYSDSSWRLTLAVNPSANNVQAVYHCLQVSTVHGAAPSYLTEMCVPVAASTGRRCLRSAARGDLMVPRRKTITYGSRSFAVSGPRVWNDLPPILRSSSTTLGQFQSRLKTTLFRLAYGMWLGAFVTV